MKRMISACLRFEAPDLWLAVPAALFPVLVVEVTALMIAATEDDPEALVLLPGVGMILTVVLCCVLPVPTVLHDRKLLRPCGRGCLLQPLGVPDVLESGFLQGVLLFQ